MPSPPLTPFCNPEGGKPARKCGNRMTRLLTELVEHLVGCRVKAARHELEKTKFDEFGCEARARKRYDDKVGRLNGCPSCLVTGPPAVCWSLTARLNSLSAYCDCSGPPGLETCDDKDRCTRDACVDHKCTHTPDQENGACPDDGSPCTDDVCLEGACAHPPANEGNACASRDRDDKECTDDICEDGKCAHPPKANGTSCADADLCDGEETCRGGECVPGFPLQCNTGNFCTGDMCDPKVGCIEVPVNDGKKCQDGDACTSGDMCTDGVCLPDDFVSCNDGNDCTIDTCSSSIGCVWTPDPRCFE